MLQVNINVLIIEINHAGKIFKGNQFEIRKMMTDNGYKLYKEATIDYIFAKRSFLKKLPKSVQMQRL